jgi:hypothetical protein
VDALLGDIAAQHGRQDQALATNFDIKKQANEDEGRATYNQTISRINSVRQASAPNPLAFMITGLSGAVNAYTRTPNYYNPEVDV